MAKQAAQATEAILPPLGCELCKDFPFGKGYRIGERNGERYVFECDCRKRRAAAKMEVQVPAPVRDGKARSAGEEA